MCAFLHILGVTRVVWFCMFLHVSVQQFPTDQAELTMTAVEDLSTNIEVTCGFNENLGPAFWAINGSIYDLYTTSYPYVELDSSYTLRIPSVFLCLNDTTFQCIPSMIHLPGRVTTIYVVKSKSNIPQIYLICMHTYFLLVNTSRCFHITLYPIKLTVILACIWFLVRLFAIIHIL